MNNLEKNLKENKELSAVLNMRGGKILIETLSKNVISAIMTLTAEYEDLESVKMRAILAETKANLDIIRLLKQSDNKKEFYE